MEFNQLKFKLLRHGPNEELKNNTLIFNENYNDPITRVENATDLGIIFEESASFSLQRQKVIRTTNRKAGWILRTFKTRDPKILTMLWNSLAQPHIDYANALWNPAQPIQRWLELEGPLRSYTKK